MQAHYLSIKGLEQLIHTISKVKLKINPCLDIAGILGTAFHARTSRVNAAYAAETLPAGSWR